jgi:hypothetical protein
MRSSGDNMREVSRAEFFASVGQMNVHPHNGEPQRTLWKTPDHTVHGVSYPGWKNPGDPKRYFVRIGN